MLYTSLQLKYRENCLGRLHPTHAPGTIWKASNVAQELRESVKQVKPAELNMHVLVL